MDDIERERPRNWLTTTSCGDQGICIVKVMKLPLRAGQESLIPASRQIHVCTLIVSCPSVIMLINCSQLTELYLVAQQR